MNSIQGVCDEMKGLEGTVGAFVWQGGRCLGSSLPKAYDATRLNQMGSGLSRLGQLTEKAGYDRSACVFHWPRATLFSWVLPNAGVLAIVALPKVARGELELSAAIAMEELGILIEREGNSTDGATSTAPAAATSLPEKPPTNAASATPPASASPGPSSANTAAASLANASVANSSTAAAEPVFVEDKAAAYRLEQIELLLITEVGPTGRALFQRLRRQACQPGASEGTWLPRLRSLLLGELKDPCARAVIAASVLFIPSS